MTFTGTIVEWIDGTNFGYIQPEDPDFSRVFIHRNHFMKPPVGELVGMRVEFEIAPPDPKRLGKKEKAARAHNVKVIGRSKEGKQT